MSCAGDASHRDRRSSSARVPHGRRQHAAGWPARADRRRRQPAGRGRRRRHRAGDGASCCSRSAAGPTPRRWRNIRIAGSRSRRSTASCAAPGPKAAATSPSSAPRCGRRSARCASTGACSACCRGCGACIAAATITCSRASCRCSRITASASSAPTRWRRKSSCPRDRSAAARHRSTTAPTSRARLALLHAMGPYDVGQAAVVALNHVLAVEAAEGTDGMLARVAELRAARAHPDAGRHRRAGEGGEARSGPPHRPADDRAAHRHGSGARRACRHRDRRRTRPSSPSRTRSRAPPTRRRCSWSDQRRHDGALRATPTHRGRSGSRWSRRKSPAMRSAAR